MRLKEIIENIGATAATYGKVLLMSGPVFKRGRAEGELVILGNGPSLRDTIDHSWDAIMSRSRLCVNFAANVPEYASLRPQYYVLADPHFFLGAERDVNVRRLHDNIRTTDWPMQLFVPHKYLKVARRTMASEHVQLLPFNLTPGEGLPALVEPLYSGGLAMPRPRNVLIPSIMIGMRLGFRQIWVCGADHTWSRTLSVDEQNRVVSVQPHFYKDGKEEQTRVNTEYAGYHLHDILMSLYIAFRAYHRIAAYAGRRGVRIINATRGSMIDAFERGEL